MEIIFIALKDLLQSVKNWFLIAFALLIPLLLGGFYFVAFGGISDGEEDFQLPETSIAIVNLDQGHAYLPQPMGNLFITTFTDASMPGNFTARVLDSETAGRQAVELEEADVAVIIPADFSAVLLAGEHPAAIQLIAREGENVTGVNVVQSIVQSLTSSLQTSFTASTTAYQALAEQGLAYQPITADQFQANPAEGVKFTFENVRPQEEQESLRQVIMKPTLGGMMIFFAFFTGCSVAMTILDEEKKYTLQRMFTAPFSRRKVLFGKSLAAWLTVFLQISLLLLIARILFGLRWGHWGLQLLLAALTATIASGFGVCVLSFLRNEKSAGVIYSGLNTITGMVAIAGTFNGAPDVTGVSLFMPQGWPLKFIYQMPGGYSAEIWTTIGVILLWSAIFFAIGIWQFNRRYRKEA
ncbi:MAG: ABC transporter permease [Anaerolineae bacterium]|nr:ABC transporter permease [Anaerolineae bacterium]